MMYRKYISTIGAEVVLPETIFDEMKEICHRHYPKEAGGVFIGHIEDGATVVIEKMIVPRRFFSTPVFFTRTQWYINRQLKKIWKESNGHSFYVGEWHCHPNMSSKFSTTDFKAMVSIASNRNVRMKNPILVIVSYKPPVYSECTYVLSDSKLHAFEKIV